jgi:hypothetical protein
LQFFSCVPVRIDAILVRFDAHLFLQSIFDYQ